MKVLVLSAHPKVSESVTQMKMLSRIQNLDGVTIHELYGAYLCGMGWLKLSALFVGRRISNNDLSQRAEDYREFVLGLHEDKVDSMKHLAKSYRFPINFKTRKV